MNKINKLQAFSRFQGNLGQKSDRSQFKNFLVKTSNILRHPAFSLRYRYWDTAAKLHASESQISRLTDITDNLKSVLYIAVHDGKNIAHGAGGTFQLILDEGLVNNDADILRLVMGNISKFEGYVKDTTQLLQWVRFNDQSMQTEPLELVSFIKYSTLNSLQPVAEAMGLKLELEAENEITAMANPAVMGRVLENLVTNSMKFTPNDGSITIRLFSGADKAVIEVRDSGVGIPSRLLDTNGRGIPKIFVLGENKSETDLLGNTGTGVGLPVCHGLIEAMGGSLDARNNIIWGATFTITLPLAKEEEG
ncbi:Sensor histidine kinase RcsC [uncultured archaeon]|nr:Sensor histidine kinase RcsC [uncultured archaeon]